ncbi:MAG: SPFH domain-containing protein [Succinivibrionaceae bacterium]|nr:SPFH domain-containing protein [Succinivibrionaceae bacterium]
MGLIRAAAEATLGTLQDQWKDFFTCDAIDPDILVVRGRHRGKGNSGSDNVISQGSGVVVADGQCMIIVDQGVVTEVVAEPGLFTYDASSEPSVFAGDLNKDAILRVLGTMWERFKMAGDSGRDQRVYYFNVKEIMDNKFGTAVPIPFRVVDRNVGLDIDVSLRCNGAYSFRITDPVSFYANVCGNVAQTYDVDSIRSQLKSEFLSALQPALGRLSELGIRPSALPAHVGQLCEYMNQELTRQWSERRGISIVSIAINSVTLPEEDQKLIRDMQRGAAFRDPRMAAAQLASSQADAMRAAAANEGGAVNAFMGMGMAQQSGGFNPSDLFRMGQQAPAAPEPAPAAPAAAPAANAWQCECGARATGKFCPECGKPRPSAPEGWKCSCGATNLGKFCTECGKPRPKGAPLYRCDKCGWRPEDPAHPPKFCPECGDPFDDNDIVG